MAFSHHKLTIGGDQTAGAIVTYLADAQGSAGDYYSESKRAPMAWAASDRARAQLGLGDQVELWKVESLLRGQHPLTGKLLRRFGPTQTMVGAIDCTLSPAPKSVSILWAMAPPDLKRSIELDVVGAVAGAMAVMTHDVPLVRDRYGPGKNEVRAIKANDVVGLEVLHTTARQTERDGIPDPQLHVHALLFSDLRQDGSLRAIDSMLILQHRSELDAQAQTSLAWELQRAGFELERTLVRGPGGRVKRIAWEVKGIPPGLVTAMSGRNKEIAELATKYREETGRLPQGPLWEKHVADQRGPKSHKTAEELHAAWRQEAEAHGLTPAAIEELLRNAAERARDWQAPGENSPQAEQLRQEILADLCRDHALVPMRQLHAFTQWRAIGLLDPSTARRVVAHMFGDGDLFRTADDEVTTLEVLAAEQRAQRDLERLAARDPAPAVTPEVIAQEIQRAEENGRPFDHGQREAITLAVSGARFVSITGPAGTGKGYASRAMVNLWKSQGRRVFVLAVAGSIAQRAGHDSGALPMTLDGFHAKVKHHRLTLTERDVVMVDEAEVIDHHRYASLMEDVQAAGQLVQIGDGAQLSPVGPGGLWRVFHGLAKDRGATADLVEVHRTKDPAEIQAWTDLRQGRVEEALSWYRDVGRLRLYDTRAELRAGLVAEWWARRGAGHMLVDTSNQERDQLNQLAQTKRLEAGELGAEPYQLDNGREVRAADRILFAEHPHVLGEDVLAEAEAASSSSRAAQPRIENGTEATVLGVEADRFRVALHEPGGERTVELGADVDLELGYARHVAKGLGMTTSSADIATSMNTGQQELYVILSRSQEGSRVHALKPDLEQSWEVDVQELEAPRVEVQPDPQLQEMPLNRESDMESLRMLNRAELRPHQVVSFREALPLREPSGVELGELGVIRSVHRGGVQWDHALVELVGGREVRVYQPDPVEAADPELDPSEVLAQPGRADQRDPYGWGNLPLVNGQILQAGDQVRLPEQGQTPEREGHVIDVPRRAENRAVVQLADKSTVSVYATHDVTIVKTGQQLATERLQAAQDATIKETARTAERSEAKRAIGAAELQPAAEAEGAEIAMDQVRTELQSAAETGRQQQVIRDKPGQPVQPGQAEQVAEAARQNTLQAAHEAQHEPGLDLTAGAPTVDLGHEQLLEHAAQRAAGHEVGPSAEPTPEPAGVDHA